MKRIPCLLFCMPLRAESGLHALQKMDYFVLIMWTLPVTILKCTSMPFLTILWIGSLDKAGPLYAHLLEITTTCPNLVSLSSSLLVFQTLQLYCLCCVSFAATLTGGSGIGGLNQGWCIWRSFICSFICVIVGISIALIMYTLLYIAYIYIVLPSHFVSS